MERSRESLSSLGDTSEVGSRLTIDVSGEGGLMSSVWEMSSIAERSEERIGPVSDVLRARGTSVWCAVVAVAMALVLLVGGGADSARGEDTKLLEMWVMSRASSSWRGRL